MANRATLAPQVRSALFTTFPSATTPLGDQYKESVKQLTGGERPMFNEGFAGGMNATVWGTFGRDGTVNGILNKDGYDTTGISYRGADGRVSRAKLNGVAVSPLTPLLFNEQQSYVDHITSIQRIRP